MEKLTIKERDVEIYDKEVVIEITDDNGINYRIFLGAEGVVITKLTTASHISIEPFTGSQIYIK